MSNVSPNASLISLPTTEGDTVTPAASTTALLPEVYLGVDSSVHLSDHLAILSRAPAQTPPLLQASRSHLPRKITRRLSPLCPRRTASEALCRRRTRRSLRRAKTRRTRMAKAPNSPPAAKARTRFNRPTLPLHGVGRVPPRRRSEALRFQVRDRFPIVEAIGVEALKSSSSS